jgi:hypothetical protein
MTKPLMQKKAMTPILPNPTKSSARSSAADPRSRANPLDDMADQGQRRRNAPQAIKVIDTMAAHAALKPRGRHGTIGD